ncbi:dephospho-CoA kinase [Brevibacterium daeguense]|uniref:Dephospho-CoA kinase n=1 Tax=Brevibacterium daeguense TaxID=909936 RepID=A0ABP8EN78_9MICO|nr:dephospho-CoA kinase [Brevibacterium daeguense]
MLRIGLTGGIGAGKSTVAQLFRDHGAAVIDADVIAREVVEPGSPALSQLAEAFGVDVVAPDGTLQRTRLAEIAFADPDSTARLNGIMHPAIRQRTEYWYERYADRQVVVHDVPLLVENGMSRIYHLAVLVDVSAETRIERLTTSRGMDEADARRRIAAQASDQQRYEACDVVLDNHGSPADLAAAFEQVWSGRISPFAENLDGRCPAAAGGCGLPEHPVSAVHRAGRTRERIETWLRLGGCEQVPVELLPAAPAPDRSVRGSAEPTGAEQAPGAEAPTVICVRAERDQLPAVQGALSAAGFPAADRSASGADPAPGDSGHRAEGAEHRSADPCNPARVLVTVG